MFVGVSNWISCSGTTDIPQEMFLVHHRKWLWAYTPKLSGVREIPDGLLRVSGLKMAAP